MASDSALIVVSPSDSVDTIIQKVRGAGADSVELLVPDGTASLQALGGFARLRQSLERDRIGLLVISSDEKTLNAARLNHLDTMGVQGAQVTFPAAPDNGGRGKTYATRVLHGDEFEQPAAPPIADQDAEFLDALDQVAAQDRYAGLSEDDAERFAELDDLSEAIQHGAPAGRGEDADDDLAAALDEWAAASDEGAAHAAGEEWESAFGESAGRRRVRPEDVDLSDEEVRRQGGGRRTEALRERARGIPPIRAVPGRRRGAREDRLLDLEEAEDVAPQRRRRMLAILLPLLILLLLALLAAVWFFSNRVTVSIAPPAGAASEHPFNGEVIPMTANATDANAAAVQAVSLSADAEFTTQGQVISETLAPVGTAKGVITIYNELPQRVELPAGTEFIATNSQGQEVRFILDVPAVVPPAVTTSSVIGRSTTNGAIDVAVTARSPGSPSNVGQDAIKQILIPGQQPIASDSSNFLIRHGPIGGGGEQSQRIVTNDDVERVLGDALTGLYNAGVQALRGQIDEKKIGIDLTSVSPDPQALSHRDSYEPPVVDPPVGQPVDPNNPQFRVTVRARFTALAAPRDRPVSDQLQTVVPQYFSQRGNLPCKPGEKPGFAVSNWHWDTTRLTIDGAISCTPGEGVARETVGKVRDAVRGRSRAEAEAGLQALQEQGLIGSYRLPDRDRFPGFDPLLEVAVGGAAQPTPGTR